MLKRIICILSILVLAAQSAFAGDITFENIIRRDTPLRRGVFLNVSDFEAEEIDAECTVSFFSDLSFEEYLAELILESEELPEIISGLGTYRISRSEFANRYFDIALKRSDMLLSTSYGVSEVLSGTDIVESIIPVYVVDSKAEADTARSQMKKAVKEYTDLASAYNTDLEKMLVIHDKMVADCVYDDREDDKDVDQGVWKTMHHALGVLRDKKAVCQGYSQALYAIAKELGIELDFCLSESGDHMWNYVKLGGEWYHMDMTNDDLALPGGEAMHDYFMLSDNSLSSPIHGSDRRSFSGKTYNCTDTKYESDHFFNMLIPFTAARGADGCFSASIKITDTEKGVSGTTEFKSKSLYTGAVVSQLCLLENNLYYLFYPTKNIESSMLFYRHDNRNQTKRVLLPQLAEDGVASLKIAANIPQDTMSFTTFLWDAANLTPYTARATWSQ